ncbi:MAG: alkaline phosphatase family protein [Deltaproteobacteria bacterium]|nr:alkaline phosphatase family protein [Deltaproteobacteria bacterium]
MHAITLLLVLALTTACGSSQKIAALVIEGESKTLRERTPGMRPHAPESPQVLILAFDGVSRRQLYQMLRANQLPNLTALLGGHKLAHAYMDDRFLSTLPSSTMAAWATAFTGKPPAEHGITGNEYFVRETTTFACPAPVSFKDAKPTLEIYTDGYFGTLSDTPTLYEHFHGHYPDGLSWVAMHQVSRGADRLMLAKHSVLATAFSDGIVKLVEGKDPGEPGRDVYEALDEGAIDVVTGHLAEGAVPDLLTVYLSGTDLWAHISKEGPDEARRKYLVQVVDPQLGKLMKKLTERGALANRWVFVTSDHGHTEVVHDDKHALYSDANGPSEVLRRAGFRVRKATRSVPESTSFDAVVAYGGATAYVYVADRTTCTDKKPCAWNAVPRYEEDVLAAAEVLHRATTTGAEVPGMKGTLDLILVRRPKPIAEVDLPFEVYVGAGKTTPLGEYLKANPHPTYIATEARLRDLAVGKRGERAGDIMLIANNGNKATADERYYFAHPYRSWHGSPSRDDSEIPLIVAHPKRRAAAIGSWVRGILGDEPFQQKLTDLVLGLRDLR